MKRNKNEEMIRQTLDELLAKLQVAAETDVLKEEESFKVNIKTQESGLLIGYHGETLNSLQLLLGLILYKKTGQWLRVVLDVGGYRTVREESIKEMVGRIVAEVEAKKEAITLPYLSPIERRIVHLMLTDHPTVMSQSEGEGRERRVVIKPKNTT